MLQVASRKKSKCITFEEVHVNDSFHELLHNVSCEIYILDMKTRYICILTYIKGYSEVYCRRGHGTHNECIPFVMLHPQLYPHNDVLFFTFS